MNPEDLTYWFIFMRPTAEIRAIAVHHSIPLWAAFLLWIIL